MRRKAALLGLLLALGLTLAAGASAATITVPAGGTDDFGSAPNCTAGASTGTYSCPTFRDAVNYAATIGNDPTIQLAAGTFTLAGIDVQPTVPMTITGAGDLGSGATTITGAGINGTASSTLTVTDLALSGGACGGILGENTLTVTRVSISGEQCRGSDESGTPGASGGLASSAAIQDIGGMLDLTDSVITDNHDTGGEAGPASAASAGGTGGAADAVILTGGLQMSGTVVSDNTATGGVGGSSVSGDQAAGDGGLVEGAGIDVNSLPNATSITSSLITDNVATGGAGGSDSGATQAGSAGPVLGGGLYLVATASGSTPATITGSTISGNSVAGGVAASDTAAGALGGNGDYAGGAGLYASGSFPLDITASTFSGNTALVQAGGSGPSGEVGYAGSAEGGAMYLQFDVDMTALNTTIADNTAQSASGSGTIGTIGSFGGGIDVYGGASAGLNSVTIAGNAVNAALGTSAQLGANIYANNAQVSSADTVIADPAPSGAASCATAGTAAYADGGHNFDDTDGTSTCGVSGLNGTSGLATTLAFNRATGIAATATTPAIPAPQTLSFATGSALRGNGGACTDPFLTGSPAMMALGVDERGFTRTGTCDIGAFQAQPLAVSGEPEVTGTPAVGQTLTCATGGLSVTGDGAPDASGAVGAPALSYAWMSGSAHVAQTATYTVASGDQGHVIQCSVTVTGYGSTTRFSTSVLVPAASVTPGGNSPGTVPVLTAVKQTNKIWAEKKRKHGPPVGTTFSYTLNEPATVYFTFSRPAPGRKLRGGCVAPSRKNRKGRRCTRSVSAGAVTVRGAKAGANTLAFTGKTSRGKLKPGFPYAVTVTAIAGGLTSHPQVLRFTVKK